MEDQSSSTYRESSHKTTKSSATANGRNDSDVSLKPSVEAETYNKVHHDLDVAAAHRKPIVTESKYKVKVAEPGVDSLHLADHDHVEGHGHGGVDRKSEKSTVVKSSQTTTSAAAQEKAKAKAASGESQKGQFIAKPDVYGEKGRGAPKEEKSGGFSWVPLLGGAAAIAGIIAGAMFYKKRNPDVDVKIRRSVEDADHRVKGAIGSGERKVKELIGSGQQKFNNLIHRGEHHVDSDDEGHSHSHNALNVFGSGEGLYQVKQGDNLTKIARKSGKKNWHEIAEKNPSIRNPDLIYPGDRLKL
jgi:nucleoid-associated protein YgaU